MRLYLLSFMPPIKITILQSSLFYLSPLLLLLLHHAQVTCEVIQVSIRNLYFLRNSYISSKHKYSN